MTQKETFKYLKNGKNPELTDAITVLKFFDHRVRKELKNKNRSSK
jgi:hypothetical protein